jgi:acetyl esterase/lipase
VWTESEIQVTTDVHYGEAYNHMTKLNETLMLDYYEPPQTVEVTKRPVVIFIHGGAFHGGDKGADSMRQFCTKFAMLGYCCASINYRLTGDYWSPESQRAPMDAVEDTRAAVRYMRKIADEK